MLRNGEFGPVSVQKPEWSCPIFGNPVKLGAGMYDVINLSIDLLERLGFLAVLFLS